MPYFFFLGLGWAAQQQQGCYSLESVGLPWNYHHTMVKHRVYTEGGGGSGLWCLGPVSWDGAYWHCTLHAVYSEHVWSFLVKWWSQILHCWFLHHSWEFTVILRRCICRLFFVRVQFINSKMFTIKMYKLMNTSSRLISPYRRMHTTLWKYVVL